MLAPFLNDAQRPGVYLPGSSSRSNGDPMLNDIRSLVDDRMGVFYRLWNRQWSDQETYDLEDYLTDGYYVMTDVDKHYRYISAEPKSYANKLIHNTNRSKLYLQIPTSREREERREINQVKRDFIKTILDMADERLLRFVRPRLMHQLSQYAVLRGWYAGRAMLRTNMRGELEADIMPWDPLSVVWDVGPDGLDWICHLSYQTISQIRANHPDAYIPEQTYSQDQYLVYDFYQGRYNAVFADGLDIKQMTPHGFRRPPVFLGMVGGVAMETGGSWHGNELGEGLLRSGESCYEGSRHLYTELNNFITMIFQIVARSARPGGTFTSPQGRAFPGDNPFETHHVVSLMPEERLEPLEPTELAKEFGPYLQFLLADLQRATLPHSQYGAAPDTRISGFAVRLLEGQAEDKLMPYVWAVQDAYRQISELMAEQFTEGYFPPVEIPGGEEMATPQMVAMGDKVMVKLVPQLPRNDAEAMAAAQMARDPGSSGVPLLDDATVRELYLHIEDEEGMQDRINEQQAERLSPSALARTFAESASKRGNEGLVGELEIEYIIERLSKMIELAIVQQQGAQVGLNPGMGGPQGGMGGNGPEQGNRSVNNAAAPQQVLGMQQPNTTPDQPRAFRPPVPGSTSGGARPQANPEMQGG